MTLKQNFEDLLIAIKRGLNKKVDKIELQEYKAEQVTTINNIKNTINKLPKIPIILQANITRQSSYQGNYTYSYTLSEKTKKIIEDNLSDILNGQRTVLLYRPTSIFSDDNYYDIYTLVSSRSSSSGMTLTFQLLSNTLNYNTENSLESNPKLFKKVGDYKTSIYEYQGSNITYYIWDNVYKYAPLNDPTQDDFTEQEFIDIRSKKVIYIDVPKLTESEFQQGQYYIKKPNSSLLTYRSADYYNYNIQYYISNGSGQEPSYEPIYIYSFQDFIAKKEQYNDIYYIDNANSYSMELATTYDANTEYYYFDGINKQYSYCLRTTDNANSIDGLYTTWSDSSRIIGNKKSLFNHIFTWVDTSTINNYDSNEYYYYLDYAGAWNDTGAREVEKIVANYSPNRTYIYEEQSSTTSLNVCKEIKFSSLNDFTSFNKTLYSYNPENLDVGASWQLFKPTAQQLENSFVNNAFLYKIQFAYERTEYYIPDETYYIQGTSTYEPITIVDKTDFDSKISSGTTLFVKIYKQPGLCRCAERAISLNTRTICMATLVIKMSNSKYKDARVLFYDFDENNS